MEYSYGTDLKALIFRNNNDTLLADIRDTITRAILFYEPRIDLDEVLLTNDDSLNGRIDITVVYTVRSTNSRTNFVFPFYLNEGTNLPYKPEPSAV
jgi:phage baseplate assembly protein W